MGVREPKLSSWRKMEVCRWLAEKKYTQTQIAEMCEVTPDAVSKFAKRNASIIEEIRNNLEDEMAGMWVAKKKNRIAYLMRQVELVENVLDAGVEVDPSMLRAGQAAIKQIAEELGQLPSRLTVVQAPQEVRYIVEGVDPSDVT
jgi:predicted transcriptional regulator